MERFLSLLVSRAVGGARISTGVDAIWQVIVRDNIHGSGAPVHAVVGRISAGAQVHTAVQAYAIYFVYATLVVLSFLQFFPIFLLHLVVVLFLGIFQTFRTQPFSSTLFRLRFFCVFHCQKVFPLGVHLLSLFAFSLFLSPQGMYKLTFGFDFASHP